MQRSESINELAAALAKAQGQMSGAKRDSENPFFKSKYADLQSVWDACRFPLSSNGLAIVQLPRFTEQGVEVETSLVHSSGQMISETLAVPVSKQDAQGVGSAITYARRYALAAFVGVCPEDDDGNAAAEAYKQLREKTKALLARSSGDTATLETAWNTLSVDAKRSVQDLMPGFKEAATKKQTTTEASHAHVRDKALASLKAAAGQGIAALEEVWKALDSNERAACRNDLPALKEEANNVTTAA